MEKRVGVFFLLWLYECIFVVSAAENTDFGVLALLGSLICPHMPFVPIHLQGEQSLFAA